MNSSTFSFSKFSILLLVSVHLLHCGSAEAQQPVDNIAVSSIVAPTIIQQPANAIAATNEDISLNVTATGFPLNFQWLFNGNPLNLQTNASLLLTNLALTESGYFSVIVANSAGSVTSSNAVLSVQTNIVRRLGTGRIVQIDSQVGIPITFRSNGRESSISFSLNYDTNILSNPVFSVGETNAAVTSDTTHSGSIGIALSLPDRQMFPAGYQWVGLIRFNLAAGHDPVQARISFSSSPIPIAAVSTNGQILNLAANVLPEFLPVTTAPTLNPQSGLFEHQLLVSNPGSATMTNLDILALNPGVDLASNAITFFNAQGSQTNLPYGDPLIEIDCNCPIPIGPGGFDSYLACGNENCSLDYSITNAFFAFSQINNLLPGESRRMTIEYYVTDHRTRPTPQYSLFLTDPFIAVLPSTVLTTLSIDRSLYSSNSFLVEFSTVLGMHYYLQYADTPAGLATGQIVFPPTVGTGSRIQWIDNGPPKTVSPPLNGSRFYRVLSDQP
ncbi:MAG: hypothetical protein JWM99_1719, partial [Verrucomicrobiales bacterium]|nr:hypothetical protein [Verrucomicrobiales bacterium]